MPWTADRGKRDRYRKKLSPVHWGRAQLVGTGARLSSDAVPKSGAATCWAARSASVAAMGRRAARSACSAPSAWSAVAGSLCQRTLRYAGV